MAVCAAHLEGHVDRVWCVSWSPCGTRLATAGGDKSIRIWAETSPGAWSTVEHLDGIHMRTVRSVAWAPTGKHLASASFDGTVAVWEFAQNQSPECIAALEGHENEVKSVAWNAGGSMLATGGRDKTVWIWEMVPTAVATDGEFECAAVLRDHTQDVKCVKWHPHHDVLASASYDDSVRTWVDDDGDWACATTLRGHDSTVWSVDFDASGTRLFSCSADCSFVVWAASQAGEGARRPDLPAYYTRLAKVDGAHARTIYSLHVHGDVVATGGADDAAFVHRITPDGPHTIARIPTAHNGDVNCVAWCPRAGQMLLATGGDDRLVKLWKVTV